MATTTHPPQSEVDRTEVEPHVGSTGDGGNMNLTPADGPLKVLEPYSPEPSRTGIWIGLAAITMSFAAFTSALVVRHATANDWRHLPIPSLVFLNTLVLLFSSGTLEVARRRVAEFARGKTIDRNSALLWLNITLSLGFLFVAGQCMVWRQLRAEGLFLASNPNSSFFYVLTAMHAVHVLGGLGGLMRVIYKLRQPVLVLRRSTLDATSYYWHFMGILWLYLLWVIWIKL